MYRILNPARMITGVIDDSVAVLGVISIVQRNQVDFQYCLHWLETAHTC